MRTKKIDKEVYLILENVTVSNQDVLSYIVNVTRVVFIVLDVTAFHA